jgi:hypothetical protein
VRRTRGSEKSRLMAVLASSLWLAAMSAVSAAAQDTQQSQDSGAVAPDANRDAVDRELRVPTRTRPKRPEGEAVELDSLMHLPSGFLTSAPNEVAGAGESEWRRRFTKAQRELSEARASLDETKRELDEVAVEGGSSQWAIAAPGGGGGESSSSASPLSFKLRQKLREDRERIEVTERAMRTLRIEADLAGVPQAWRVVDSTSPEPDKK